jgi:alkanesulfonate monooxygenase SsuD/methylene tetrahydromethanopterin reductase-like flavin-dependent oxidoreductase (luciferase family)
VSVSLAASVGVVGVSPREDVELVRQAQDWGYTAAWAAEVDGPEAFTMLGAMAMATDMDLGVAVVPVQTRTPFVTGMAAMTVAGLTGGRLPWESAPPARCWSAGSPANPSTAP